jgi:hypothetical protein
MLSATKSLPIHETVSLSQDHVHVGCPPVDNAPATGKIKSEHDDSMDEYNSSSDDSNKPTYLSSMSFVNLVETIFVKKDEFKPMEHIDTISSNIKDELLDSTTITEEIPFLTIKRETECEFLINETTDNIETTSD